MFERGSPGAGIEDHPHLFNFVHKAMPCCMEKKDVCVMFSKK